MATRDYSSISDDFVDFALLASVDKPVSPNIAPQKPKTAAVELSCAANRIQPAANRVRRTIILPPCHDIVCCDKKCHHI